MRDWSARLLLITVCAIIPLGLWMLLTGSRGQHLLYPEFSSLRSDEKGVSVWYESLRLNSDLQINRSFRPLAQNHWHHVTLLLLGVAPRDWGGGLDRLLSSFETIAGAGNRVVLTLDTENTPRFLRTSESMAAFRKRGLNPIWQKETLVLQPGSAWKILRGADTGTEAIERATGKGALVLASSSTAISNRGIAGKRDTALLVSLVGSSPTIIFDESHLGVVETGTILGLARHYRLQGFLGGLLVLCLLFVWRNAGAFPPRPPRAPEPEMPDSLDGFARLLEHSLPQHQLIEECVRARVHTERSPQRRESIREIALAATRGHDPLQLFQQAQLTITRKRRSE